MFRSHAALENAQPATHGCLAHLLNIMTKIAMKDNPHTEGAMVQAREKVTAFNHSSQLLKILLSKQAKGKEVGPIQDVPTR